MAVITLKMVMVMALLLVMAPSLGPKWVGAQVHHVVGGDRGWDPSSDVASWSSHRRFSVGDKIWFAYSAAEESIIELKSREEYESCDVKNPIRMYTDGLDGIELDGEGIRYFVTSNRESCKKGLKLHVEVMPFGTEMHKAAVSGNSISAMAAAIAPTTPSESVKLCGNFLLSLIVCYGSLVVCYFS